MPRGTKGAGSDSILRAVSANQRTVKQKGTPAGTLDVLTSNPTTKSGNPKAYDSSFAVPKDSSPSSVDTRRHRISNRVMDQVTPGEWKTKNCLK